MTNDEGGTMRIMPPNGNSGVVPPWLDVPPVPTTPGLPVPLPGPVDDADTRDE